MIAPFLVDFNGTVKERSWETSSSGCLFDCFCMYKCRPCSSQLQAAAYSSPIYHNMAQSPLLMTNTTSSDIHMIHMPSRGCQEGMRWTTHVKQSQRHNHLSLTSFRDPCGRILYLFWEFKALRITAAVWGWNLPWSSVWTTSWREWAPWNGTEGITIQAPEPSKILSANWLIGAPFRFITCYCSKYPNSGWNWPP